MPSDEVRRAFARRLRVLMKARGLSVKSLLWMMGEGEDKAQKVYSWMNGERLPSFEGLLALQAALRCDWKELMGK